MTEILVGIMTLAVVVTAVYLIFLLVKVRGFVDDARNVMSDAQRELSTNLADLRETLSELQATLRSVRHITDNVGAITDRAVVVADAAKELSENVRKVSRFVGYFVYPPSSKAAAWKMGIQAGLGYAAKHLLGMRKGRTQ